MSGLLDKKARILDFIITDIGREEMTKGEFSFDFAAFTDLNSQYDKSDSFDHTSVITFEATSLPSDTLITDLENNGLVLSTRMSGTAGRNISQIATQDTLTINEFNEYITGSSAPIQRQRLIGVKQHFVDEDEFIVTPLSAAFAINDYNINRSDYVRALNSLPNIFQDSDFKSKINFRYLPPILANNDIIFEFDDIVETRNGMIDGINKISKNLLAEIIKEIDEKFGTDQLTDISFTETSAENNLIIQLFEIIGGAGSEKELRKLKIVRDETPIEDNKAEIYYIGRTARDARNVETFLKLFGVILLK